MTNAEPTAERLDLRPGESSDACVLADLFVRARRAAEPAMPAPVHTPSEISEWFAGLGIGTSESPHETWVAQRRQEIVGYLILDPQWLHSLYVRHDVTGQGVGSALLDLAKSLRPRGFGLWVFETNEAARRFYERHGLISLERTDGRDNEEQSPDIAMVWPGTDPVAYLRREIDTVDADLGKALARRYALTAAIQQFKPVAGHAGRDHAREAEVVSRLAEHAPDLGEDRISRILQAIITESLDAADKRRA